MLLQLAGCAGADGSATGVSISNIDVGMTQTQVLSILGQPRMRETYGGTEFLFYTNDIGSSIPIAIVDGRVTSIGRAAYDIVVRSKAQAGNVTPR
jgi:outer membrane protein assembly factor BamE (lipoprotein component of BamABCDE complex)